MLLLINFILLSPKVFDRADLAYGMQASPQLYNSPGGQYSTMPPSGGNQVRTGPPSQQNPGGQYVGGPAGQYPGGPYGGPLQGSTPPGGQYQQYAGAPGTVQQQGGPAGALYGTGSLYGPGGQYVGAGGPPGGGKQSYEASSQDWDGNTLTARTFREEMEAGDDGTRSYRQQTTQVNKCSFKLSFKLSSKLSFRLSLASSLVLN